jgi:hypothetical protein
MYPFMSICTSRQRFECLGPTRDYEVLIDGTKSGLFGMAFCVCKFEIKSGSYELLLIEA